MGINDNDNDKLLGLTALNQLKILWDVLGTVVQNIKGCFGFYDFQWVNYGLTSWISI